MAGSSPVVPDEQAPRLTEEQARHLHCSICGNDDADALHNLDEPITVGPNTALVRIRAAVCRYCGERVFDLPNRARLEQVRDQLARGDVSDFEPVGVTYRVP